MFLHAQLVAYQVEGYTTTYPSGANAFMGYAYPNMDTDGDGLIDGMERLAGTSSNDSDSDSDDDGTTDGIEFPQAGVAMADSCAGPNVTCTRPILAIFSNGFE